MELLKLIGVLIVVVGFTLRWDTIATVVAAGIATVLESAKKGHSESGEKGHFQSIDLGH